MAPHPFNDHRQELEPGFRITLAQVRRFLPRHKWTIAGVFVFTALAAYASLSLITELYDVRAALLVKLGRENLDAPVTARNGVLSTGVRREELGSEVQILRSSQLLGDVVDQLGVEAFRVTRVPPPDLPGKAKFYVKAGMRWAKDRYNDGLIALDLKKRLDEREAALSLLVDRLVAEPQKESDVIALSLRIADPALGVRIQETLIQKYLARRVEVRRNRGVKEFFESEVADLRTALDQAEQRANEWRAKSQLTLPAEQKALLLRQIRDLSAQRERSQSRLQALRTQVTAARGLMSQSAERVRASQVETPSAAAQQFRERLSKLENDRARLLTTYLPGAAPVRTVEDEIANLRQLLAAQKESEVGSVTTSPNPLRQQLEQSINQDSVALTGLTAEVAAQQKQIARLTAELDAIESADTTLVELERDRKVAEQNYLNAVQQLTDADIESQLDVSRISNVSVATPPASTLTPVYPRKLLLMGLALVVGLVLGAGVAALLEWTSDTISDAQDAEAATELPCLATFGGARGRIGTA
jgi:polysaccharide biosynthesis protein PslE